jgi:hypothetical protein
MQGKQKGSIGIAIVMNWMVPYSNTSMLDQQATQKAIDFRIGWYAHRFFFIYLYVIVFYVGRFLWFSKYFK